MKRLIFIFVLLSMFACGDYIDKPKNLIDENTMADIIADMGINEQVTNMFPNKNVEGGTRFILKSHHVKSEDFTESFKYYVVKDKMIAITEEAQKKLLEKDPKADKYVKDKINKRGFVPSFAR